MDQKLPACPDCDEAEDAGIDRRGFLKAAGTAALAGASAGVPLWAVPKAEAAPSPTSAAETAVKALYEDLTPDQKKEICFAWDYQDPRRGLLRSFVSNNWQITRPHIRSEFYTKKQQHIIHDVFKGIINPEWYSKFLKQLKDDTGGKEWGADQSIAIFGTPGSGKFEFVMTGRHMTIRADGNTEAHVAFGGPIFYGHAASGFNEKVHHPGNVFWPQAQMANKVYQMLDTNQREKSLLAKLPAESAVAFRGAKAKFPGIAVAELAEEQKKELQKVLDGPRRALSQGGPGRGIRVPKATRGSRWVQPGVLQGRRHRRRWRVGQLAAGRTGVRLVLPRLPPCSRLGQRRRRLLRAAQRHGIAQRRPGLPGAGFQPAYKHASGLPTLLVRNKAVE